MTVVFRMNVLLLNTGSEVQWLSRDCCGNCDGNGCGIAGGSICIAGIMADWRSFTFTIKGGQTMTSFSPRLFFSINFWELYILVADCYFSNDLFLHYGKLLLRPTGANIWGQLTQCHAPFQALALATIVAHYRALAVLRPS